MTHHLTTHYFDDPLLWPAITPSNRYSNYPLLLRRITLTTHYSYRPLLPLPRGLFTPTTHYHKDPLLWCLITPTIHYPVDTLLQWPITQTAIFPKTHYPDSVYCTLLHLIFPKAKCILQNSYKFKNYCFPKFKLLHSPSKHTQPEGWGWEGGGGLTPTSGW